MKKRIEKLINDYKEQLTELENRDSISDYDEEFYNSICSCIEQIIQDLEDLLKEYDA